MADRLRASLSAYFAKHVERGDWRGALRALRGCAVTGTRLDTLPHASLFPFLVAQGQWGAVLRLSAQLLAAGEEEGEQKTGSRNTGAAAQEESLMNTLLRATVAEEAVANMGSWQAAAAIVQRAAQHRVRLETSVVRDVLKAVETWQQEIFSSQSAVATEEARRCNDVLLLMRDVLKADLHLREKTADSVPCSVSSCHASPALQPDLLEAIRDAARQEPLTKSGPDATHWQRLMAQLRASFALSWRDAVFTVLYLCSPRSPSGPDKETEVVDGELQATIDYITVRPDIAERVLHFSLGHMFDAVVIAHPPSNVGDCDKKADDDDDVSGGKDEISAASLAWWEKRIEMSTAVELPKWEAVKALAVAEMGQRERRWGMAHDTCSSRQRTLEERRIELSSLRRLCAAVRLLFLRGDVSKQKEGPDEFDDMKLVDIENVVHHLLLHGAVVTANGEGDAIVGFLAETIQSLLVLFIRFCRAKDRRHAIFQNHVTEREKGETFSISDGGSSERPSKVTSSTQNCSAVLAGRDLFWSRVLFPHAFKLSQDPQISAAWQALLRCVFADGLLLTMWFHNDKCLDGRDAADGGKDGGKDGVLADEDGKNGGPPSHRRRRRRVSGPKQVSSLGEEALRQLNQLIYFIGRRYVVGNTPDVLQSQRVQQQSSHATLGILRTENDQTMILPALSKLLTHQKDVEWMGRTLLRTCVGENTSVADTISVWRTYLLSIAQQHARPLLQGILDSVISESHEVQGQVSRVALVAMLHESDAFSVEERAHYTAALLRSVKPRTDSWHVALVLFNEAALSICQQHHSGKEETSLSHILDALVVQAAPPRWRESLQVAEVMHEVVPHVDSQSGSLGNRRSGSCSPGGGPVIEKIPLSESERIDLYESLAPLKRRQHWMSAIALFDAYERRRLSGHDAACFAFAIEQGPLAFARRVLLAVKGEKECRAVAEAALRACEHSVHRAVRSLQKQRKEHSEDSAAQERTFVLHEANQVARLALAVWPRPVLDEADFTLIWKHLKRACAGNVNAARLLLRNSVLYDSEQAKAETEAMGHTIRLCFAEQDAASALTAYRTFRKRFIGMVLPEETMLQLLKLSTLPVEEQMEDTATEDGIAMLCTVLKDTLWMHDSSMLSDKSHTAMRQDLLLKTCKVVFALSPCLWSDKMGAEGTRFLSAMSSGMRRHVWRLLKVFVRHIVGSDARLLRDLPDIIRVLRALPLHTSTRSVIPQKDVSAVTPQNNPIAVLLRHVQRLEQKLGPVVQVECLFWLSILQDECKMTSSSSFLLSSSELQDGEMGGTLKASCWPTSAVLISNDEESGKDAQQQLEHAISRAVDVASRQESQGSSLTPTNNLRCRLLHCIIEALVFFLRRHWHARPPLTALLAAADCALRHMHTTPDWISGSHAMEALASLESILLGFRVRHVTLQLATTAHPNGHFSPAANATLSRTQYKAVLCMREFVTLTSTWMKTLLRNAEKMRRQVLDTLHVQFMVRLLGNLMGTCTLWPESTLREDCMHEIRRLCEGLQRCVKAGYVTPLPCSSLLLLRVMYTISQAGTLSENAAERLVLEITATFHVPRNGSPSEMSVEEVFFSDLVLATALVHTVRCGPLPGTYLLRPFLPVLQLDKELRSSLQKDEAIMCGLVAMQSAQFGSSAAVRRAFGAPLRIATRFLTRFLEFSAVLPLDTATTPPLWSEEQLVEMTVFASLAACRSGEASSEEDVTEAMDAVGTIVAHRWDLVHAIAVESPLSQRSENSTTVPSGDIALRRRLAFAAQCCGPWPGGVALRLLLAAAVKDARRDGEDVPDDADLLEVMTGLDGTKRWRVVLPDSFLLFPPLSSSSSLVGSSTSHLLSDPTSLLRLVLMRHREASIAASIILGNATQSPDKKGAQNKPVTLEQQHDVLSTLCSSDAAVQFIAAAYATRRCFEVSCSTNHHHQQQEEQMWADWTSWLSSSSFFSPSSSSTWPWNSLCVEARQLLLWSRVSFTVPLHVLESEKEGRPVTGEQRILTTAMSLVASSSAVIFQSVKKTTKSPLSFSDGLITTTANDDNNNKDGDGGYTVADHFVLGYPQALFSTAWVLEMCTRQFASRQHSEFFNLCRTLRVFPDSVFSVHDGGHSEELGMISANGDAIDMKKSLFATPSGFTSLQYVYALFSMTPLGTLLKLEQSFFVSIACCQSMEKVATVLEKRLSQRTHSPLALQSLCAAWNTVLIRSLELESGDRRRVKTMDGNELNADVVLGEDKEARPLHHRTAAALIGLALNAVGDAGEAFVHTSPQGGEPHPQQQLVAEIFVHSMPTETIVKTIASNDINDALFYKTCAAIVSSSFLLLEPEAKTTFLLDAQVKMAMNLVKEYANNGATRWISLWPPPSLEMSRSRSHVQSLSQKSCDSRFICRLRHPAAVSWMLLQSAARNSHAGSVAQPMMRLFNIFSLYVTTGVATFEAMSVESSATSTTSTRLVTAAELGDAKDDVEVNNARLPFVCGAGAGLVVDQFIDMAQREWSAKKRRSGSETRDGAIIRRLVDAIFPRVSCDASLSFLSGYTPLSGEGLRSLVRLLALRDGLDKRHTATVKHVVPFLQMAQRRETARRIAAHDAKLPLAHVRFGCPRRPWDLKVQLLFFLRAFAEALTFMNPLGWHSERQATLDVAYTVLLDFLQLHSSFYGDVDITSRAVTRELENIFAPGVLRVVRAASLGTENSHPNEGGVVTLRDLHCFLTGNWQLNWHSGEWTSRKTMQSRGPQLHRQLSELLTAHRKANVTSDVLLIEGDEMSYTPPSPLFPKLTSIAQEALWNTATTPSSAMTLEILDAAVVSSVSKENISAARCGLEFFSVIAPYIVLSTLLLEKVLVLLVVMMRHYKVATDKMQRAEGRRLCEAILNLLLCRFQYIPLNTPTAVALLCQLYAMTATTSTSPSSVGVCGVVQAQKVSSSSRPTALSSSGTPPPGLQNETQQQQAWWLLWRCAVEANSVALAPLQAALSSLRCECLQVLQRGCLAFLSQDHTKLHYDPPFLRFGRILDTVIHESAVSEEENCATCSHIKKGFAVQVLHMLEENTTTTTTSTATTSCVVPWRRAVQFLQQLQEGNGGFITEAMRCRFYVALLSRALFSAGDKKDAVRQIWHQALSTILPVVLSDKESNEIDQELKQRATAFALRTIHVLQPPQQWTSALQLTLNLSDSVFSFIPWWSSLETPLFHLLRYFVEACDLTVVSVASLIAFLRHVATRQSTAPLPEVFTGRLNRAKVVAAFAEKMQRHPYLGWVDALAVLESVSLIEKTLAKSSLVRNSNNDSNNDNNNDRGQEGEAKRVLSRAKGDFVTAVMERLFRKQSYEPMLRFVDAAQPHYRVSGRQALACVNHAASVLVPPGPNGGFSEVLLLLNGSLVGRTLDDILREHSAALLQERVRLLRDLLRNGRCGDAAVLARQSPALLQTREFYNTCTGLMSRFHHRAVALFYDELLHPEVEEKMGVGEANDRSLEENESTMTTSEFLEADVPRTEDVSPLTGLSCEVLKQALMAFEVAVNSAKGIDDNVRRTGLWITAAWIRCTMPQGTSLEPLAATLRWVQRDVVGGDAGGSDGSLRILADAIRDVLASTSQKRGYDGGGGDVRSLELLQHEREVARLLLEVLSGTLPEIASQLCDYLLLQQQQQASQWTTGRVGADDDDGGSINANDEWWNFLRSTATYNAALQQGSQHCLALSNSATRHDSRCAIVEWRDRLLFASGSDDGGGLAWVSALAAYTTSRSFVGHAGVSGAHAARLVKFITTCNSFHVLISAARNVFFHASLSKHGGDLAPPFLEAMVLLSGAMRRMKRHTVHRLTTLACEAVEHKELQAILLDLQELNRFIADGVEQLMRRHQLTSTLQEGALDGRVELACGMIRCLTVTPVLSATHAAPLADWRSNVQRIIGALPPSQRQGVLLDAFMESVRDSFEVLRLVKQHSISSIESSREACNEMWLDALGVVSADESLRCHLFVHTAKEQRRAMMQLETFLCCASLATDGGGNVEAMKSLCHLALRRHAVPLTEDAKAVVKMACIHRAGSTWRSMYETVTGFAPTTVQREATLSPSEEAEQQNRCERALGLVAEWDKALQLCQLQRENGVRLRHVHYRHMLNLLEQNYTDNNTVDTARAMGEAVMALHFAQLQDGCPPSTQMVEKSLRLLSHPALSPLCALQYAQAVTLLPSLSNRRHRNGGTSGVDASSPPPRTPEDVPLSLSSVILCQVTAAAQRLPGAVREFSLAMEEAVEGLRMFASFVHWASDFSRVPCLERDVMEAIVLLLCTPPLYLLFRHETSFYKRHENHNDTTNGAVESAGGDLRSLLLDAFVVRHEGVTAGTNVHSSSTSLDTYRFVCRRFDYDKDGPRHDSDDRNECRALNLETLSALRTTAEAALHFIYRQASLHRVLRVSEPLLCRLFAAVTVGVRLTRPSLRSLSRIAQNTELISPPLRCALALTVAEQSVLWRMCQVHEVENNGRSRPNNSHRDHSSSQYCHYLYDCPSGRHGTVVKEIPASVVVREVTEAYDMVCRHFAPPDAVMLRGLLLPNASHKGETKDIIGNNNNNNNSHVHSDNDKEDVVVGRLEEELGTCDERTLQPTWEHALTLFNVFLRNAQPHADLSVPFAALTDLLCRCGQWSVACRSVTLAGSPSLRAANNTGRTTNLALVAGGEEEDTSRLLATLVVVDGFLLRRLYRVVSAAQKCQEEEMGDEEEATATARRGRRSCVQPQFWRVALHLLQKQQRQLLLGPGTAQENTKDGAAISSAALLAIMKEICRN